MNIEFGNETEIEESEVYKDKVAPNSEMKSWMVNYVGEQTGPENDEVTVGMIVETMAKEFPEFLMAVAEENWIRGYHQALEDVTEGERIVKEHNSEKIEGE